MGYRIYFYLIPGDFLVAALIIYTENDVLTYLFFIIYSNSLANHYWYNGRLSGSFIFFKKFYLPCIYIRSFNFKRRVTHP